MLSRFQLLRKSPFPVASQNDKEKVVHGRRYLRGWVILAGLTAAFTAWILYRALLKPSWPGLFPVVGEMIDLGQAASAFTLAFLWVGLWWQRRKRDERPRPIRKVTIDGLYQLSPKDFEKYVGALFRQKGYTVALRGRSGDHGVDLELVGQDGRRAIVQLSLIHI